MPGDDRGPRRWRPALLLAGLLIATGLGVVYFQPLAIRATDAGPSGSFGTSTPLDGAAAGRSATPPAPERARPAPPGPGVPSHITIPTVGVDTTVIALGLDGHGAPAAPPADQRRAVAWYDLGPMPGSASGNVLMNGHTYLDGSAVFNGLSTIKVGDPVVVTVPAGRIAYDVQSVRQVGKADYPRVMADAVNDFSGPPRLVLTTCSGDWDPTRRTHLDVTVVFAAPRA